jgi:hypothetical protein
VCSVIIEHCYFVNVIRLALLYESYSESNLRWGIKKTSNEKLFLLYTKNTYEYFKMHVLFLVLPLGPCWLLLLLLAGLVCYILTHRSRKPLSWDCHLQKSTVLYSSFCTCSMY